MSKDEAALWGARIVFYRTLKGYSQLELAETVGITRQYLSKLEHGHAICSMKTMCSIAEILEIDPGDIISLVNREDE